MEFQLNVSALLQTEYALTPEQLELRVKQVITLALLDCEMLDLHVNVEIEKD